MLLFTGRRRSLKFFDKIIRHKVIVITVFLCAAAVCAFLMLGVGQNYDMSKYLPGKSNSKAGIDILESEYSYNGSASTDAGGQEHRGGA